MKKSLKTLTIAISIVATTALLTGCGNSNIRGVNQTNISQENFTPTKVNKSWYDGYNSDESNANISFFIDDSMVHLSITNIDSKNFANNQFFINSDDNTNTGNVALDGADYLIENSHIFRSTGRNWSWSYVGEVDALKISNDHKSVEVIFNKSSLGQLANQMTVISFQRDANWKTLQVTEVTREILPQEKKTQKVVLKKGWNLVGINSNATLEELKNKIGANNLLVISGPHTDYKKEDEDAGRGFLNDFKKFEDGEGYWIEVANDKTINLPIYNKPITIKLQSGWNLINPTKPLTLAEIIDQIGSDNLLNITGPKTGYKKSFVDSGDSDLNDFTNFVEPEGYWIKVKNDATLTFN